MTMRYTVEATGGRWVASNGTDHIEAETPDEALYRLLTGEDFLADGISSVADAAEMLTIEDLDDHICRHALALIRLLAIRAPSKVIRITQDALIRSVDQFLAVRGGD